MSSSVQWVETITPEAGAPPGVVRRRKNLSDKDWEPYDSFIIDLRDKGIIAKEIHAALRDRRGLQVGLDALKKRLRRRTPKNEMREAAGRQLAVKLSRSQVEKPMVNTEGRKPGNRIPNLSMGSAENLGSELLIQGILTISKATFSLPPFEIGLDTPIEALAIPDETDLMEAKNDNADDLIDTILARIFFNMEFADGSGGENSEELFLLELCIDPKLARNNDDKEVQEVASRLAQQIAWNFENITADDSSDEESVEEIEEQSSTREETTFNTRDGSPQETPNGLNSEYILKLARSWAGTVSEWWDDTPWNEDIHSTGAVLFAFSELLEDPARDRFMLALSYYEEVVEQLYEAFDLGPCERFLHAVKALAAEDIVPSWILGFAYKQKGCKLTDDLRSMGDAIPCFQKALEILHQSKSQCRPEWVSLQITEAIWELSQCYRDMGNMEAALAGLSSIFQPVPIPQSRAQSNLMLMALETLLTYSWEHFGEDKCLRTMETLIDSLAVHFGAENPRVANCRERLAHSYTKTGQHDLAINLRAQVYQRYQDKGQQNSVAALIVLSDLVLNLSRFGRHKESIQIYFYMYRLLRKERGELDYQTILVLTSAGVELKKVKHYAGALKTFERSLRLCKETIAHRETWNADNTNLSSMEGGIETEIMLTLHLRGLVRYAQPFVPAVISRRMGLEIYQHIKGKKIRRQKILDDLISGATLYIA